MYRSNLLPSVNPDSSDPYFDSLDLIDHTCQFSASEQHPTYKGMPVQTMKDSFSVYTNELDDVDENNTHSFHLLNKYKIIPLTLDDQADFFITDIPEIPQSALDEYVPWNLDNKSVNNPLSSTLNIPLVQQECISKNEPEIRMPTSASHSDPDYPLTNPPVAPPDPEEDLRPVAVVNPQNLNQTTNDNQTPPAEEIIDDNSAIIEGKRERKRERQRKYKRERRKDPAYAERERERQRERRKDPAFIERERKRQRELRKDPAFVARKTEYNRKYQRKRCKDPAYLERQRKYIRERCKDPAYAERQRERQRELRKDPAFIEREREAP
ncbi:hypothetical protein [Endozoicomonas sp. YOMI1]|uniref:hypothetical protein n=1 Tax=Endozoicomonas sp. YOMI1 TaxID=2828739 RepID=UPI00214748CF|nr:hypothetical protein [Endozoicomonas sp. YOMI1]